MKTQAWHRTVGLWIGILTFSYQIKNILFGQLDYYWLFVSSISVYIIALSISVGYHRLFTHGSFECSRIWHYIFGIIGSISLNSSPVHWSIVHLAHHKHADTPLDANETTWRYFFRFRNRSGIEIGKSSVRLMRDPFQQFLANYSFLLFLLVGILLYFVNFNFFLYGFLSPIGLYLLISGIHTIYAHHNGSPKNYWYLEFIFPTAGEWNHKYHHQTPRDPYFTSPGSFFDGGGAFIKLIKK